MYIPEGGGEFFTALPGFVLVRSQDRRPRAFGKPTVDCLEGVVCPFGFLTPESRTDSLTPQPLVPSLSDVSIEVVMFTMPPVFLGS